MCVGWTVLYYNTVQSICCVYLQRKEPYTYQEPVEQIYDTSYDDEEGDKVLLEAKAIGVHQLEEIHSCVHCKKSKARYKCISEGWQHSVSAQGFIPAPVFDAAFTDSFCL